MVGFILTVAIAIIVSLFAQTVAADKIPNGIWGAIPLGILGAWIGAYTPVLNFYGPVVDNAALIPSALGSAVVIAVFSFFRKGITNMVQ